MYNYSTDVLVIGGGGAGAMAAYEASKHGVKVTMVLKGYPQRNGATLMAPGAIAGVGDWHVQGDSRDLHFQDTVKGGAFMNEQNLVRIMVEKAPELILEMERIGALWQREKDGETYSLRIDGGHTYPRCPFLEDRTGREMLRTLFGELEKRNINILANIIILELVTERGKVTGAIGLNLQNSETVLLRAKSVILACGGAGTVYQNTDNPADVTGDGYALSLGAGADLMDMEFVQFYPLGFLYPDSLRGVLAGLLYYVQLINNKGERFMSKYDPERLELSTRDRVARAIFYEVREGRGGPHGGVFADMTYQEPGFIARMTPALAETYRKIGLDPEKDYVEMAPTCHFIMGGIRVDDNWQSTVVGLYAAGENTAGIHGANRLSQNALAEILVSGSKAGSSAAEFAANTIHSPVNPQVVQRIAKLTEDLIAQDEGIRPVDWRNRLRKLMWENVGVVRSESGLREAVVELKKLKSDLFKQKLTIKSRHFNHELIQALENHFLFTVAQSISEAALQRTESRGAHFRNDFPKEDNENWLKHLVLRQNAGRLEFDTVPVNLNELKPEEV